MLFNGLYLILIITLYNSDYMTGEVGVCAQGHFDGSKRGVNHAVNWCPVWCREPLNCWDFPNMHSRFMNSHRLPSTTHTRMCADKVFAKSSKHLLSFPSSFPPRLWMHLCYCRNSSSLFLFTCRLSALPLIQSFLFRPAPSFTSTARYLQFLRLPFLLPCITVLLTGMLL